jgi:hypothetical protein
MQGSTTQPKVFISYSWTTPQHERWVVDLAERLSGDGIVVILDKWDLKEGQDKHKFMEQMVHDESIDKVLIICDRGYQAKGDDRKGGVGTESQLISKEVYDNTAQEKFIPIVRELDQDSNPCMPHFMGGRIYIDLSSEETFEENYQKLIRNVYGRPLLKRPPLGSPPAYITDEEQVQIRTTRKIAAIKDALMNDRRSVNGLIADFLEAFLSSFEDFRLSGGSVLGFDDKVVKSVEGMLPLRDDFIDLTLMLFKYQNSVDLDQLHAVWEKLIAFTFRPENVGSWVEIDFDNFRFFNYELMLYFIAALLHLKKYREAAYFVNSTYFYRSTTGEFKQNDIVIFNRYMQSLDEFRNNRLKLARVSVTADLIKARATRTDVRFENVREADSVLHHLVRLRADRYGWFPRTSIYGARGSGVEFFQRLVSQSYFEKVKPLFDVKTVGELKELVGQCIAREGADRGNYTRPWEYNVVPIEYVIDTEKIATSR